MEVELQALYAVSNLYRDSLDKIFENIGETISDIINTNEDSNLFSSSKRYKYTVLVIKVLEHYSHMIYKSESLYEELISNLVEVDSEIQPQKENTTSVLNSIPEQNAVHSITEAFASADLNQSSQNNRAKVDFSTVLKCDTELDLRLLPYPENPFEEEIKLDLGSANCINKHFDDNSSKLLTDKAPESHTINEIKSEPSTAFIRKDINMLKLPPVPARRKVQLSEENEEKINDVQLNNETAEGRCDEKKLNEEKRLPKKITWKLPEVDKKTKGKKPDLEIYDDVLTAQQVCTVIHVEDPSEFYVRTNQTLFEHLDRDINEFMNNQTYVVNNYKTKLQAATKLGSYCFGFLTNKKKWFRLEVLDWMDNSDDSIFVHLVDYGENLYCHYNNLRAMNDFYAKFPKMAIKCHMAGIHSTNSKNRNKWSASSCYYFMELCGIKKMTKFIVIFVHKEGSSFGIELQQESNPNEDPLGEKLVTEGHARSIIALNVEESDHESSSDYEIEFQNLNEAISGYDAQDEARLCPFTDDDGKCFKGPGCKKEHGRFSKDGFTTDKVAVATQALEPITLPAKGAVINILLTGYISTCHFYAHVLENKNGGIFSERFAKLLENMGSNNIVPSYEPFKIQPALGELLIVKHDGNWYRGRCVEYASNYAYEIFLVDFGTKITKSFKDIKVIKDEFLHVPFQAVECILDDCQEKTGPGIKSESINFFETCLKMKVFRALVIETGIPLRLKVWDGDFEMCHILEQYGLVEATTKDLYPKSTLFSCE